MRGIDWQRGTGPPGEGQSQVTREPGPWLHTSNFTPLFVIGGRDE